MSVHQSVAAGHERARRPVRRRRRVFGPAVWAVALAVVLAGIGALPTIASGRAPALQGSEVVRVATSQSLWSIARAHPVAGASTAEVVARIQRMNHLRVAEIQPGTALQVPWTFEGDDSFAQLDTATH